MGERARCAKARWPLAAAALLALAGPAAGVAPGGDGGAGTAGPVDSVYAAWRPLLAGELAGRLVDAPADLYKFLQQGVDGARHAGLDERAALARLEREWSELPPPGRAAGAPAAEPLLEPLRPDGGLCRLHLGPLRELVAAAAPPALREARQEEARRLLAAAFAATARREPAPADLPLAPLWARAAADTALWQGRLSPDSVAAFSREIAAAGWPAVHHSRGYVERWRPHYRVVDPALLPEPWRAAAGAPRAAPPGER